MSDYDADGDQLEEAQNTASDSSIHSALPSNSFHFKNQWIDDSEKKRCMDMRSKDT